MRGKTAECVGLRSSGDRPADVCVITHQQLSLLKRHAILVDVSIDQGGCFETSRPTTHTNHYCVANMPDAVPITSTHALTNATMPYVIKLANEGVRAALSSDPGFLNGLNIAGGQVTYAPVALDQNLPDTTAREALERAATAA